jgi:hypothetical protein
MRSILVVNILRGNFPRSFTPWNNLGKDLSMQTRFVDELLSLPSAVAVKILRLLEIDPSTKKQLENALVYSWLNETTSEKQSITTENAFCWFEHIKDQPPSVVEVQLRMISESENVSPLSDQEILVIRFALLYFAGKIVPCSSRISEKQLRMLLTILNNL